MIDVSRLRWFMRGRDVTCENCHTALYRPRRDEDYLLCPTCRHALGEDLAELHAEMATDAAVRGKAAVCNSRIEKQTLNAMR